jgi:hypothetical protein
VKNAALVALALERMLAGKADPVETLPQGCSKTRDAVGAVAGVSGKTIDKVKSVLATAPPALLAPARAGEVTVNGAFATAKPEGSAELWVALPTAQGSAYPRAAC